MPCAFGSTFWEYTLRLFALKVEGLMELFDFVTIYEIMLIMMANQMLIISYICPVY